MVIDISRYCAPFCLQYLTITLLLAFHDTRFTWSETIADAPQKELSQIIDDKNANGTRIAFNRDNSTGIGESWSYIWSHASLHMHHEHHQHHEHQSRKKRDESEYAGRAYGRGVGFFVGEPCKSTCNKILFHVFCNQTSGLCQCLSDYPVTAATATVGNRICVRASRLEESCEYLESCTFYDVNAFCSPNGNCQCVEGYFPKADDNDQSSILCIRGTATYEFFGNADLTTIGSVIASIGVLMLLFCAVFRMFSKARFTDDHNSYYGNTTIPPVILTGGLEATPSMFSSRPASSISNEFLPPSRRASYTLLAPPPSNLASRRASLSSIRSQSSLRSYSSFPSQSSFKNYRGEGCASIVRDNVRRIVSSPDDGMPLPAPPALPERITSNHYCGLKNKAETCLMHSTGINPSVPHH